MSEVEGEDKLDESLRHVDPRSDLDSVPPARAVDKYLDSRSSEVTVTTLAKYEDNLGNFETFCEQRGIEQAKELDGATLDDLKVWIREEVPQGVEEYSPETMRDQMYLLRNFLKYLEQIEAVPEGLHEKVDIPELESDDGVSDEFLEAERAHSLSERSESETTRPAASATFRNTSLEPPSMDDRDELLMTPGPTALPPAVRDAMGRPLINPDVEAEFASEYESLLDKLAQVYGTDDDVLVLSGEGMLGLEASVASLVSPGDDVLCLANGIFGEGFSDFVEMQGGNPVVHEAPSDARFDAEAVKAVVDEYEFTAATLVHCETPTGLLNDFEEILGVLQDADVLTIVDAVSSLGGTPVPVEGIDVCLGASQKCFSSPPGLTTLSVSDRAWAEVEATEQDSFYTSLAPWRDVAFEEGEPVFLPYTHAVSNLYALDESLDRLLDEGLDSVYERHEAAAEQCRERGRELGLEPFPESDDLCSPTVTAFRAEGRASDLQHRLEADHDVVVATGLGEHADDLLRVGHMGYNADPDRVERTMDALAAVVE